VAVAVSEGGNDTGLVVSQTRTNTDCSRAPNAGARPGRHASSRGCRRRDQREFTPALEDTDVVFLKDREAPSLLDDRGVGETLDADRVVVLEHGDAGATVNAPVGRSRVWGFGVDPFDTTGAGDPFTVGFIATRLQGGGLERALAFANACGRSRRARMGPEPPGCGERRRVPRRRYAN
jgi:sugar/nucleoside kinase (ribokinase family)